MKRPLIHIAAFYIFGIASAELFKYFPLSTIGITMLILIAVALAGRFTGTPRSSHFIIMAAAAFLGFTYMLWMDFVPADDISRFPNGEKMTITGLIDEPVQHYAGKVVVNLSVSKILTDNHPELPASGRVRVTVYDPETVLSYGDEIRFTAKLKKVQGFKNPGIFDYAMYVSRKGIRASMGISKKEGIIKTGEYGNPVLRKIYRWREVIRMSIKHGLSDNSSAVLQAMIIGTTGDLLPEMRDKFTAAGVTHILSISGSHLGFVAFLMFFSTRYLLTHLTYELILKISIHATPSKISAIITMPPIVFYSLLSGGEVATIRSLIMAMVFLLAIVIDRDDDPLGALALAALLVLIWNPQGLFDISFQLSYSAVLSMIMTVRLFNRRYIIAEMMNKKDKWKRKVILFLMLTFSATASTTPIVAHYFNQITWAGLLSNMVIIPFVGFTVVPLGLITSIVGLIFHADKIPLSGLNELLMSAFIRMAELFASFPFSVIRTPSPGLIFIMLVYIFLISIFFLRHKWIKVISAASIALIAILVICRLFINHDKGMMRITFLDVGQGDSALVEFTDRTNMIIDGGGTYSDTFDIGRSVIAPYLWNRGIRKLDYMMLSHPQTDHVEGLVFLLDNFQVNEVWTNGMTSHASRLFDRSLKDKGVRHLTAHNNIEMKKIGGCDVRILNPPPYISEYQTSDSGASNDLSVVIHIACRNNSVLLTGDITKKQMVKIASNGAMLRSNIVKVPHHGSRGSIDNTFISSVDPDFAVISAGYMNSYHHPSPETISAYIKAGAEIYRTDQDGAVMIASGNNTTEVFTYEDVTLSKVSIDRLSSALDAEFNNIRKITGGCCHGGF